MNWGLLILTAAVGCPWSRPVVYSCQPVVYSAQPVVYSAREVVYLPCTTVRSVASATPPPAVAVQEDQAVANANAQTTETDENAVAPAVAEESELRNASYRPFSSISVGGLELDWGVASIGPGILTPNTVPLVTSGGGGAFGGGSGSGGGFGGFAGGTPPSVVNNNVMMMPPWNPCCCCPCKPDKSCGPDPQSPDPVPEPHSIAMWTLLVAGFAWWCKRRQRASVLHGQLS